MEWEELGGYTMSSHTERYKPHPHSARNVNQAHHDSLTVNDKIALRVSGIVGTMWFCYGLALVMFFWALLQQAILPGLRIQAIDPYPFSFLFFCLGGIMQSLLMPMIMVEQNRQSRHAMQQADSTYNTDVKVYHDTETLIAQNNKQFEVLEAQNKVLEAHYQELLRQTAMLNTALTPRRRPMKQVEGKE